MSNKEGPPKGWKEGVFEQIDAEEEDDALDRWDRGLPLTAAQEAIVQRYRTMVHRMRSLPPVEPPVGWEARARARFRNARARERRRMLAVCAVLVFIAVAAAFVVVGR